MKIQIDTNIVIDYALIRQPFYDDADLIFSLIEQKKLEGFISATTFTDVFYIIKKPRGKEWTLNFLQQLLTICKVTTVDERIVKQALLNHYKDLEDDIQYYTALFNNLDAIVTRNQKDYPKNSKIEILTPKQLLKYFT
ncbi:MAG: PIN domain-containing protein [Cyanobacteria bacterium]|nr:PIN domain-containing protein [Cyanobacteria bacterium CG_2015-16_32_12]NCO76817.1 PIN domain-containing protein [Cyanobacteria bacterium CG_2015-22_32_23]NCQ05058.1 PIN domain-containing protein [Cyanobacteria bacterium CG_2015-09_32_10]NCQ42812.1 PIN domain-containing protein [Cyanobacteria bacterium CG_2015-04_32_10]NCS85486.1 PIN domain-containing protein [Cyanobacteria bacterium CG_2015-02_32_10]